MSNSDRILTEEELRYREAIFQDQYMGSILPQKTYQYSKEVIASHRALLTANAALSFKNMELQTELAAAKGNALLWRDKATIHQSEIEELQNELAAEKEASEIWRRRLIKKGVETE